jgi:hypothetical protein
LSPGPEESGGSDTNDSAQTIQNSCDSSGGQPRQFSGDVIMQRWILAALVAVFALVSQFAHAQSQAPQYNPEQFWTVTNWYWDWSNHRFADPYSTNLSTSR